MIEITKDEAIFLKDKIQDVRISMTGRQKKSKRKKYYAEETYEVFDMIKEYNDMYLDKKICMHK